VVLADYLPQLDLPAAAESAVETAAAAKMEAEPDAEAATSPDSRPPQNLRGLRVLELGCGAGLLAIAAAQLGAEVTATDLDPRLLELCAANADANRAGAAGGAAGRCATAVLRWGDAAAVQALGAGVGWDVLLAADCIYQPESTRPLLETLEACCALRPAGHPRTRVVFGYKTRFGHQVRCAGLGVVAYELGCENYGGLVGIGSTAGLTEAR